MIKRDELARPDSCINRAADDEPVFVLRGKDAAAPAAIRWWIDHRMFCGLNSAGDAKLEEASQWAVEMELWRMRRPADK